MSLRQRLFVRRLKNRDEAAFAELFRDYGDRVFNLVLRMMGSREEAEDLAQEVFITVFKSIDSFRGDAKLSTWIYRVATNLCKNRLKYLARRQNHRQDALDESLLQPRALSEGHILSSVPRRPDHALASKDTIQMVELCLSELEEDHRLIIVLRDMDELPYDEISEILGVPTGTIKSRLHRGRALLRQKILSRIEKESGT